MDSGATGLVMSSEFAKKQGFKLKKLEMWIGHLIRRGQWKIL